MRVLLFEPGAFARRLSQPSPGRHLFSGGRTCLPLSHMPNTNHKYPRHTSSGDGRSLLPIWLEVVAEMHSEVEVDVEMHSEVEVEVEMHFEVEVVTTLTMCRWM